ncbi:MAG: hypothetical protein L0H74_05670, partial [Brachybacterium sp.]|nr:hypothetical protein [Brachybacterium sp.]
MTDRHASDGEERNGESVSPAHDGSTAADGSAAHEPGPPHPSDTSQEEYGYGEDPLEAAGTGGPRAADSGSAPTDAATAGTAGADDGAEPDPGADPATGLRSATAPRAVLRPVPEGFPTPPPR